MSHKALWYRVHNANTIACLLCPRACLLKEGEYGSCQVRHVEHFELVTDTYGKITALANDPIEKKPLYHFYPGSRILSIGTFGCNFACTFCQNWRISQGKPPTQDLSIRNLVRAAGQDSSIGVAFTYNEPSIWYEYITDAAPELKQKGHKVVLVTNGYIQPEPLEELLPFVDAMNIDLKSSRDDFYKHFCGGRLAPVLETIRRANASPNTHVEVTHLIVTGQNDRKEQIHDLINLVADINKDIPLHFSRYFPQHRYTQSATSTDFLQWAWDEAREKLSSVYLGNLHHEKGAHTICPSCGAVVIRRLGYETDISGLNGTSCRACGTQLNIVN